MADRPIMGQRVGEGERLDDYAAALSTIRAGRSVFLLVLILSFVLNIGVYCAARWGKLIGPVDEGQTSRHVATEYDSPSTQPTTAGTSAILSGTARLGLPLVEFLGPVCCALLALCYLLATNVFLVGGLGGVRGSVSAFFWILALMAFLFPWGRWFGEASGVPQIPGVYLSFDELLTMPSSFRDRTHEILHHIRHLGYPVLALMALLIADRRFASGYRQARRQLDSRLIA